MPPKNPYYLADGLKRMLDLLQNEPLIGKKAKERIVSLFNMDLFIKKIEGVLMELLEGK